MDREKTIVAVAVALVVVVLLIGGLAVVFIWGLSPVALFRTASSSSGGSGPVVAVTAVPPSLTPKVELPEVEVTRVEVTRLVVTAVPSPTPVVCTPLPEDMSLNILYESDRHGIIEVEGLQPGERPILLLYGAGEVTSDWWRKETQYENAVGEDGLSQYKFDFRGWESVEGYEFSGQLIHQRGVACFTIDLPEEETAVPIDSAEILLPDALLLGVINAWQ